ncbi:hypothetical protein GSI_01405 [Ganoderma sinense ZZ0214-1]|uniref:Uncharacterized protein n=1 Tax=Ganoderma sinense ZZ0214-1 TaxID=1077348 RepID=A0A2G8SVC0_9APHY|nr:hypothetical protein GSI_01405 [Ganoderma sinense ZZ0214-1]
MKTPVSSGRVRTLSAEIVSILGVILRTGTTRRTSHRLNKFAERLCFDSSDSSGALTPFYAKNPKLRAGSIWWKAAFSRISSISKGPLSKCAVDYYQPEDDATLPSERGG